MACSTACSKYDNLSKSTMAEVETTLAGTDTSNLKASFRRAHSFSIPPPAVYRNHQPGAYSHLIFGPPLVEPETSQDNVSRVMRMCIEEVERRGLNTKNIHLVSWLEIEACVRIHVQCHSGILRPSTTQAPKYYRLVKDTPMMNQLADANLHLAVTEV